VVPKAENLPSDLLADALADCYSYLLHKRAQRLGAALEQVRAHDGPVSEVASQADAPTKTAE
jgi:hypothetical protein